MSAIVNVDLLPTIISEKLHTRRVSIKENNGSILLIPIQDEGVELWGLLADGKFTSKKFMDQKRKDKELES